MILNEIPLIQPLSTDTILNCYISGSPDYSLAMVHYIMTKPRFGNVPFLTGAYMSIASYEKIDETLNSYIHPLRTDYVTFVFGILYENRFEEASSIMEQAGFSRLSVLETFLKTKTNENVLIYNKPDVNTAFVFAPRAKLDVYHTITSFYPKLFPSLFRDNPCTEQEIKLLKSLISTIREFREQVKILVKPYEKDLLRTQFEKCLSGFRRSRLAKIENEISRSRNTLMLLLRQYSDENVRLEDLIVRYEGMKVVQSNDQEELNGLIEYVTSSPNIRNFKYQDDYLLVTISTLLTNIDSDKFTYAIRSNNIYNDYTLDTNSPFKAQHARKIFLDALFHTDEPELYVKIAGSMRLGLSRASMDIIKMQYFDNNYNDDTLDDHLENPHYARFACPHRNRDQIVACLSNQDLIAAMECAVAATGSVNIGETEQTFRPFVQELLTSNKPVIRNLKENKDLTPIEALMWLLEKEKENEAA